MKSNMDATGKREPVKKREIAWADIVLRMEYSKTK
jgi:predicted protein tyrosine phosphatase